jgi:glutamate synthase domain-containing protein 2/glutamate synthase domain-containing protein 1/glutamate synthase domain-containing protein 3
MSGAPFFVRRSGKDTVPVHDPARGERDACGIGFVAHAGGDSCRAIVDTALDALCRLEHRGAVAADRLTGDGAGLLLPIPRRLVHDVVGAADAPRAGIAVTFVGPGTERECRTTVEEACAAEGLRVVTWRPVPVDQAALGAHARDAAPVIEHAVVLPPGGIGEDAERRAFRARKRIEQSARARRLGLYVPSFSFRTVVYKALCAAGQLAEFYADLSDDRFDAWFALFHQRYSTNTTPSWERAQPFRLLGHNGELNTIRGNIASMYARAGGLGSAGVAPEELLIPPVDAGNSDSGILDEVVELLVRGGRDLMHAASMLVPPAWEASARMAPEVRDFFRYHSCLVEPWDGPAALVLSDGVHVGASLDRNGLRPLRVAECDDGLVAVASEAGAVPTSGRGRIRRSKLGPGQMLCVHPEEGGLVHDDTVKARLGRRRPYGQWARDHLRACSTGEPVAAPGRDLTARLVAAGYTKEETNLVLRPMATLGREPVSSMGDDTAQAPLTDAARPVFGFLKQRFAQVTNPPIDHLRERSVMSIRTRLGPRAPLLKEDPEAAALRDYDSFLLWPSAVAELERAGAALVDASFPVEEGPDGLEDACLQAARAAHEAAASGAGYVIVTHREVDEGRAPVPSALAAGAAHHRLVAAGLRRSVSIVVDADDVREPHHAACLLTNGADAVSPRLASESIAAMAAGGKLRGVDAAAAQRCFAAAMEEGVLKVMSKMGISTLDSYRGAQIIEAVGLGHDVVATCFAGMSSVLGGLSFVELGADAILRHDAGFAARSPLPSAGYVKFRRGGEYHAFNPDVIGALHDVAGTHAEQADRDVAAAHQLRRGVRGEAGAYARFARLVNERPPTEPRDLLDFVAAGRCVPVDEVEPSSHILRRFSTGAMSHGALSAEAHQTLAVALNMIGGAANSGEGGEAPERYESERNCAIKQVASGRFGVTPSYVASANELQIKMAQGSKPGEGGQLPGGKVSVEIARLRHTVPGVALISPPPHHDIYSIEDLAQLVYDLKQANGRAAVSVKLVSSEGVGTIASGVVKALADVVHIAGADGGTGASPLASIKHAGLPWEIGLADAQTALVSSGLRSRARLRVDGGLKTGRDVLIAALLGADEYSFGTAALVAEGCILVRTCHRNTCPVGIATQDPELRAKFAGTPEMVVAYLTSVAEEVRSLLAAIGARSLDEVIGRAEFLRPRQTGRVRADCLDLSPILSKTAGERRFRAPSEVQKPRSVLGDRLSDEGMDALRAGRSAILSYPITTADRAVGARLGCAIASEIGRPGARVHATFAGSAGQSFGAFSTDGMELVLTGEANDYVCKGMGGGRVVIRPPEDDAGDAWLAGNTVLYGATGGQLFIAGRAGERFAVRNSGAVAVVEGTGDHACEYMTAGAVVILGQTGDNLGAGMSGGEAYVLDEDDDVEARLNTQLVAAYEPSAAQLESLRRVVVRHHQLTASRVAARVLSGWSVASHSFRRIAPVAEIARLEALFEGAPAA